MTPRCLGACGPIRVQRRVQTDDPVFRAVAALTVAAAALVAAYVPARRVRGVDPVVLRTE
jgi:hypothetical protein